MWSAAAGQAVDTCGGLGGTHMLPGEEHVEVPHQVPAITHCVSVVLQDVVNFAEELVLLRREETLRKLKNHRPSMKIIIIHQPFSSFIIFIIIHTSSQSSPHPHHTAIFIQPPKMSSLSNEVLLTSHLCRPSAMWDTSSTKVSCSRTGRETP